jgi:hypothetical protein
MLRYISRRAVREVCCFLLTLAVISIPLNGMPAPRASSLIPLNTSFVSFDTSIQSPNLTVVQFSVAAPSGKRIVLASSTISLRIPQDRSILGDLVIGDFCRFGAASFPSVRAPPQA